MPIKQPEILSRADFDEAVVRLRLNVSEIAKATGIPRTYLSEYRNGDRKLRPELQAKLRDYFEEKGVEFDAKPPTRDNGADPEAPHPRVQVAPVRFMPIRGDLEDERIHDVFVEIERNDSRIAELCDAKVKRATGWGDTEGELSKSSQEEVRELFARLAANYVLVRYLTGTDGPLAKVPEKNTIRALMVETISESTVRAGVQDEIPAPKVDGEEDGE